MKKSCLLSGKFKIFILIISITIPLLGQPLEPEFEHIPIALSFCFLQDSNGFLWVGSQEGLARYDGYNLKYYTNIPFDSTSISNNWVSVIKEDNKGNLWVGTWGGGLNYFNQRTENFTHFLQETNNSKTITCKNISSLILNDDGTLWLGTQERGLLYMSFDSNGKAVYKTYDFSSSEDVKQKERDNFVWGLLKDREDKLWIGTMENGLIYFDPSTEKFEHYKFNTNNPNGIRSNLVTSICEDDSGTIWFATGHLLSEIHGTGLGRFDPKTKTFRYYNHDPNDPASICSDSPYYLFIDRSRTLWIGSIDSGLCSIKLEQMYNGSKPIFTKYENVGGNIINSIYEDRQDNIWVGLFIGLMSKYDRQQNPFIWYRHIPGNPNSLSGYRVECIYVDRDGRIWFGGNSGLTRFDPETGIYKRYIYDPDNPNGISSNRVNAICEDNDGKLWVGTFDNGISIFNPSDESFEHIKSDPENKFGLRSDKIRFLQKTKSGDIWISTWNQGLQLYDQENKHFKFFDVDSSTSNDETTSILLEDSGGTLWIGTMNDGLYGVTLENKKIKKVKHYIHNPKDRNSLSSNFVVDIIQSKVPGKNILWIATNVGLNKLDLNLDTFTHYFKKDGLPHDFVFKLLEDSRGNIWSTIANSLCVYNVITGKFNSYGEDDGLPITGFGGARQRTAVTLDGQLLFGSPSGALGFYPDEVINDPIYPQIRLTDFKIFHKSAKLDTAINFKKIIHLSYDQKIFSFEFTDLNFSNSKRNQFAYKLEGLYDDWINIGNERAISFTDIDPGKYIFQVKGVTNDGVWNETGTSIVLIIAPPWWATWLFRIIMFITIIGIGYSIYRYRVNKLLEMERLRVQIASDLHDDIGSALTRIAVHSEIIQTTKEEEKVSRSSQKIGSMSREIITTLSDVVWSIDSRNDTVGDLIDRMRDFLETVFPAGSIHIDFQTKGLHFDLKVNQSLRQNIYLIFKEAANNAAKHSGADEIKISMINGDGKFRMEIVDNGTGINQEEKQTGHHGIENMKLRAERINGELKIEKLEKGTSVKLIAKNI